MRLEILLLHAVILDSLQISKGPRISTNQLKEAKNISVDIYLENINKNLGG